MFRVWVALLLSVEVFVSGESRITTELPVMKETNSNNQMKVTMMTVTPTATSNTQYTGNPEKLLPTTRPPQRFVAESYFTSDEIHMDPLGSDYADWDYITSLTRESPGLARLLAQELRRHQQEATRVGQPTHQTPHHSKHKTTHHPEHHSTKTSRAHHSPPSRAPALLLDDFCREAALEETASPWVSDGGFHPKFEEVPGVGVYRLHTTPRSWARARAVCEREGAQLAVPNSREEALTLADIHNRCPRILSTHFNDYQYLGVHDQYGEGQWETIVGYPLEEMGYVKWAFNQPDNAHHLGENCLAMNRNSFYNDIPCWIELPFICEHV